MSTKLQGRSVFAELLTHVSARTVGAHVLAATTGHRLSSLLPFVYYPVAAFMVGSHELNLANTRVASATLARLLESVKDNQTLDKDDIEYVMSEELERIPWNSVQFMATVAERELASG